MRLEKRSTLVFPILLHTIETWDKLQPCEPRVACSEPFFYRFFSKRATAIPGKLKLIAFRASSFAHPSLLPLGLERLKNAQRLERREECTSGRKESQISTTFSFFTAASGIGESTLLQAKLTGIPFGPRGPLDPDFPRWPL